MPWPTRRAPAWRRAWPRSSARRTRRGRMKLITRQGKAAAAEGPADRAAMEAELAEAEELLAAVEAMREVNPMLGMRGVRLGILIPDIVRMQTRAILAGAARVAAEGKTPLPEIMIPLVGHVNELAETRRVLEAEVEEIVRVQRPAGGLQVRDHDRGAARRADRRRDRRARRVLQLRHQRPDPDDLRLSAATTRRASSCCSTSTARSCRRTRSRCSTAMASGSWCGWPPSAAAPPDRA